MYLLDGDPTEGACSLPHESGIDERAIKRSIYNCKEFPFDSIRKMMSVIVRMKKVKNLLLQKERQMCFFVCESILWDGKAAIQ